MLNTKMTRRGIELNDDNGEVFGYITYSIKRGFRFESEHVREEFWQYRNTSESAEYDALAWHEHLTHQGDLFCTNI